MEGARTHFQLGAFELQAPLGRGAMGEVWRGRHVYQDVPVAIKVLNQDLARDEWALSAFTNEVRAAAGLNHPNIMMLLDQGVVTPKEAENANGQARSGSPYLVMELVEGRPLHHWAGRLSWPIIHNVLSQLLEALAHSHARGVIHRDIKPGNVLVEVQQRLDRTDPNRLRIRLTDFGLAQALEQQGSSERQVAGTPAYMAPEQLRGRWRDQGPWTDLYSVGCLGWAMAAGEPPFGRKRSIEDFCHDHLHLPPPPLDSTAPVPRDLEAWLRRLLQKRPEERFTRAADALHSLNQLRGSLVEGSVRERNAQIASEPTRPTIHANSSISPEDSALLDDCSTQEDPVSEISTRILDVDRILSAALPPALPTRLLPPIAFTHAPIPKSWNRIEKPLVRRAQGVSLSLYGLSPVPMVNRIEERDALWQCLKEVDSSRNTRLVLLEGPAGCGKSRLAQWLCEEADARAGATVLHTTHSAIREPTNGLAPMLSRALRCRGLNRRELVERLAQVLPRIGLAELDEVHALAELIRPATPKEQAQGARAIRFHDARERYNLIRRVILRLASGGSESDHPRNVIVWLDDLQWGQDSLAFVQYLLNQQITNPSPILIVGTIQLGALQERPEQSSQVEELRTNEYTLQIPVDPLGAAHQRELVKSLLGKEGHLVERVARRTAGNPLFAVQLVGDWVERGVLLTGPGGVVFQPGATVDLPDNLHAIWDSRIDRFLNLHESRAGQALEVAATLGGKVDRQEWRAAAERLGVRPSPALVAGLIRHRLVQADAQGDGWSFSHPMLRECLERRARDSRRASRVHLACARMLQERSDKLPGSAERIGTHLLRGGEAMEALSYFLKAAEERFSQGSFHQVSALLNDWEQAMVAEGMSVSEPMWGQGWLLRGRVERSLGHLDAALQVIQRAMRFAEEQSWPDIVAYSLCEEGIVLHRMGESERSWKRLRKAEKSAKKIGDQALLARVLNGQGELFITQGRLDDAGQAFDQVRELAAQNGHTEQEADSHFQLGRTCKQAGRLTEARDHLSLSIELFESIGARWGLAKAVNEMGEICRLENHLGEAGRYYRQALEKMDELGLAEATIPRLNLALVMMRQNKHEDAQPLIAHAHAQFTRAASKSRLSLTHLLSLVCESAQGIWVDWEYHLSQARVLLADSGFVDIDIAMCATEAGELAFAAGFGDRAQDAWDLAIDQWTVLDRPEDTEKLQKRIQEANFSDS